MSIEMDNPQTLLEKADAAANLVEQMSLAFMMKDTNQFQECYSKASNLLFDLVTELDEIETKK